MRESNFIFLLILCITNVHCTHPKVEEDTISLPLYQDIAYVQDYSIKYYKTSKEQVLLKSWMDQNAVIQVLSNEGLLRTHDGQFLYPGKLIPDRTYRPLSDKNIKSFIKINNQFVYLDNEAVLSNAWAGKLFIRHGIENVKIFDGSSNFEFLVSNGRTIKFFTQNKVVWERTVGNDTIIDIQLDSNTSDFWLLGKYSISKFNPSSKTLEEIYIKDSITAFTITDKVLIVGSDQGYIEVDKTNGSEISKLRNKLPCTRITSIEEINGNLWFGSTKGAFMLREDGKFNYYHGERWLPSDRVLHVSKGDKNSVLILTDMGLAQLVFEEMTLYDKAMYFEKQVRDRHIRLGFNAGLVGMEKGNVDSGRLRDSDNDGLWTSLYLAGQVFRYATTNSKEALYNCRESLDAMERLYNINNVPGFPSRSFERSGNIEQLSDPDRWQNTEDPEWDWKATTSSDEAIGHIFAFGVMAELIDDGNMKNRAITLIDTLMGHIVGNDMYLVDFDGKPTTWGKWHPEYVNARPKMVGDRKLNSSNIIAMLQTAYHFTNDETYKEKAYNLMDNHGYLENLMRPMGEIGNAPENADDWSKMLSENWNHSDDEMYFIGYWGLYRYAFNDTLKQMYKKAIIDHWEAERPEKEGAWNIMTATTKNDDFDLEEAIWYLKEHPLDLIDWEIKNSHRKDIEFLAPNFRGQTIEEVLPPDERPVQRHNSNMFRLDRLGGNGTSEHSAGDIWLFPYWMGRYLGVISSPNEKVLEKS